MAHLVRIVLENTVRAAALIIHVLPVAELVVQALTGVASWWLIKTIWQLPRDPLPQLESPWPSSLMATANRRWHRLETERPWVPVLVTPALVSVTWLLDAVWNGAVAPHLVRLWAGVSAWLQANFPLHEAPTLSNFQIQILGVTVALLGVCFTIVVVAYSASEIDRSVVRALILDHERTSHLFFFFFGSIITHGVCALYKPVRPAIGWTQVGTLALALVYVYRYFGWFNRALNLEDVGQALLELRAEPIRTQDLLIRVLRNVADTAQQSHLHNLLSRLVLVVADLQQMATPDQLAELKRVLLETFESLALRAVRTRNRLLLQELMRAVNELAQRLSAARTDAAWLYGILQWYAAWYVEFFQSPDYGAYSTLEFNAVYTSIQSLIRGLMEGSPPESQQELWKAGAETGLEFLLGEINRQIQDDRFHSPEHLMHACQSYLQLLSEDAYPQLDDWKDLPRLRRRYFALALLYLLNEVVVQRPYYRTAPYLQVARTILERTGYESLNLLLNLPAEEKQLSLFTRYFNREPSFALDFVPTTSLDFVLGRAALVVNVAAQVASPSDDLYPPVIPTEARAELRKGALAVTLEQLQELTGGSAALVATARDRYLAYLAQGKAENESPETGGNQPAAHADQEESQKAEQDLLTRESESAYKMAGGLPGLIGPVRGEGTAESIMIHLPLSDSPTAGTFDRTGRHMGLMLAQRATKVLADKIMKIARPLRALRSRDLTPLVAIMILAQAREKGLNPGAILTSASLTDFPPTTPGPLLLDGVPICSLNGTLPPGVTIVVDKTLLARLWIGDLQVKMMRMVRRRDPYAAALQAEWVTAPATRSLEALRFDHSNSDSFKAPATQYTFSA